MFDFKKLDKYKKFMLEEGIRGMKFQNEVELTIFDNEVVKDFDIFIPGEEGVTNHQSWEEFKIEVTNYFLEGERQ